VTTTTGPLPEHNRLTDRGVSWIHMGVSAALVDPEVVDSLKDYWSVHVVFCLAAGTEAEHTALRLVSAKYDSRPARSWF